jgi:hypothetical protein
VISGSFGSIESLSNNSEVPEVATIVAVKFTILADG